MPFAKWRQFQLGFGKGRAAFVGQAGADVAGRATSTTAETTIGSVTLKANSLYRNGTAVRITVMGTMAATAGNKTIKLKFGTTTILSWIPTTHNGTDFIVEAMIWRTSASHQAGYVKGYTFTDKLDTVTGSVVLAEIDTADIPILVTGTAAANGDIIALSGLSVEVLTRPNS